MQKAAQAYIQTQVTTTNQGDLLILLFDGCIKFLKQAKERIAAKDYAQKGILISRALDILTELQSTLKPQVNAPLVENLQQLYFFCSTRLLAANMKMDQGIVDEVIGILTSIRGAFAQINTPQFAPKEPVSAQASRNFNVVPMQPQNQNAAPNATPQHRALAAYAQANKDSA
jgi:flagellar protein FliS